MLESTCSNRKKKKNEALTPNVKEVRVQISNPNQQRPVSMSKRRRGQDLRSSTINPRHIPLIISDDLKNKIAVIMQIATSMPYSPKKMKMKLPLLYSMLKPLTNSLSPSARSNGARLDSASMQIHHAMSNKIVGVSNAHVK